MVKNKDMEIREYIRSFIKYDNPSLPDMEIQGKTWADTRSFIEPEVAKVICLLIRTMDAKKVLEMGTCIGYSGIWMAEALKHTGGKLTTIEYDEILIKEAKQNFKNAGVTDHIELIEGDILKITQKFENGYFDMVVQDSKKSLYPELLEECIRVTRRGGMIITDDTLYRPKGITEKLSVHTHRYNEMVFNDKRLYSTIINVGDGITLSLKI
ncbi:MAG: O-methyltransferase [Proteobacteria bacterium]|nr:O-methyltransferase [Pseudomonadota bacterium]